jgi:hypothetical protein
MPVSGGRPTPCAAVRGTGGPARIPVGTVGVHADGGT